MYLGFHIEIKMTPVSSSTVTPAASGPVCIIFILHHKVSSVFEKLYLTDPSRNFRLHPTNTGGLIKYNIQLQLFPSTWELKLRWQKMQSSPGGCFCWPFEMPSCLPRWLRALRKMRWLFYFPFPLSAFLPLCCPEEGLGYQLFFDYLDQRQILFKVIAE